MPRVEWHGDRLAKAARRAALDVARSTAETVKGEAVDLCPLDSGHTREEAYVNDLKNGAEISFNTPQAAWLHESENYTPSHAGTGPGYLRKPLLECEDKFHADIAAAMKTVFGSGNTSFSEKTIPSPSPVSPSPVRANPITTSDSRRQRSQSLEKLRAEEKAAMKKISASYKRQQRAIWKNFK